VLDVLGGEVPMRAFRRFHVTSPPVSARGATRRRPGAS